MGSLGKSIQGSFGFLCQLSLRRTASQLEQQLFGFWRAQVASVDGTGARKGLTVLHRSCWVSCCGIRVADIPCLEAFVPKAKVEGDGSVYVLTPVTPVSRHEEGGQAGPFDENGP